MKWIYILLVVLVGGTLLKYAVDRKACTEAKMALTDRSPTQSIPDAMAEAEKLPECVRVQTFEHWLRSHFERREHRAGEA